ncbi:hypothetical protein [Nocardioides yefusunii]|uniref:Fenitrothion hydrolase n=1 Tax=Nocardioides yefusunii TaxID=2500546 RepID=A0ABW1QVL9_9ACTN|nr:hypothetical protein [Nocardioides yefusunii]
MLALSHLSGATTTAPSIASSITDSAMLQAHGIGGAKDLPIPAEYAVLGAVAALLLSFVVLAFAWRRPRFEERTPHVSLPALQRVVESRGFLLTTRTAGIIAFLYCLMCLTLGKDLIDNPIFGITYVLLWVGIVPASLLLGPVWKYISPFRTFSALLNRLGGIDPDEGMYRYPVKLGLWPAAVGLYLFVWMELSVWDGGTTLGGIRLWLAVYLVAMVLGSVVWGNRFLSSADPFEVYSSLLARLSPWGRDEKGQLVLMSPLRNLAGITPRPGLVAVVAVLFGSTAYDSFHESPQWVRFVFSNDISETLLNNVAFLVFSLLAGLIFTVATMTTGVAAGTDRRTLPALFAHSMVPIVVGYVFAHYFTFLVVTGQMTVQQISDPFSNGSNWFGTADMAVNQWIRSQPTLVACLKVGAVVTGHVLGAVAAHDRALVLLPRKHQLSGQLTLLTAMVVFTAGGLYLLFAA